jgi:NADH-quinone oxidoreductase subunit I
MRDVVRAGVQLTAIMAVAAQSLLFIIDVSRDDVLPSRTHTRHVKVPRQVSVSAIHGTSASKNLRNVRLAMINEVKAVWPWMGNIVEAVYTVAHGLWVTFRTWIKTYRPERKTFTEHFEYPELPVPVAARYRGFHRFDLTTCIACDQCAKACPVDCIYIGKEKVEQGKGFKITGYTIDYTKCMFCALCVEPCPVDCIFMGATHDLSCYSRDGCIVDFSRMPLDVAWGRSTLNPTAVADSKVIVEPVHGGPNQ